ncbi:LANO_0G04346g1_1 [Lachancea nothofagi CBS 11611]|uniref:LANO_0G04346g1_1 n=1 Tax=Lachancea nothofagi CBS 11611 TaxID=1266666 RepID=A0A1G4KFZ2_9SACH|nr:LANO_0G04346g1_1 [Lachancea nothofagi CBS 11611]
MGAWVKHWFLFVQFLKTNRLQLFKTYVLVPGGVIITLCILYGVDRLIADVIKVTFPSSVAVMLINFGFMCSLSAWRRPYADIYVKIIDIPLSWSLRWMNLFFTPAFVVLPLSPWISWQEALLIVAVFVIGYVVTFMILAYFTILCQRVFGSRKFISVFVRQEEIGNGMEAGSSFARTPSEHRRTASNSGLVASTEPEESIRRESNRDHDGASDMNVLSDIASNTNISPVRSRTHPNDDADHGDITSLSSPTVPKPEFDHQDYVRIARSGGEVSGPVRRVEVRTPEPSYSNKSSSTAVTEAQTSSAVCQRALTSQIAQEFPLDIDKIFVINMWQNHLHHILYGLGFLATIFTYYFSWYVMPFQFFTAVCSFMIIVDNPFIKNPKYKKLLHPVICSVALTWIVLLISVMIKHRAIKYFLLDLKNYKTGRTYLYLFDNEDFAYHVWPGAGDVFSTCMDVSIVGLSLPMYTHRYDLRRHFLSMIPPILLLCAGSLTLYPLVCYHIGISSEMSIGFIGRSITLALGTPTIKNLNGSITIMAVTTVVSGIMGVLTGGPLLDLLQVPEDDYVTRGLTLGCNCGAIATAYLLGVDRRAAAISTLSFVLFGAFMVILSAVDKIKVFVQALVHM